MRNADILDTPRGPAHLLVEDSPDRRYGTALLFHGAGGGASAPLLLAVRDALLTAGWRVARLEQPYVVAGRRAPDPVRVLDEVAHLAVAALAETGPLLLAGKSNGARIACRVASSVGAVGAVALGFPLHPPGRPDKSRADELLGAGVPVLVLQGERDAFGTPAEVRTVVGRRRGYTLRPVQGADHALRTKAALAFAAAETAAFAQART